MINGCKFRDQSSQAYPPPHPPAQANEVFSTNFNDGTIPPTPPAQANEVFPTNDGTIPPTPPAQAKFFPAPTKFNDGTELSPPPPLPKPNSF